MKFQHTYALDLHTVGRHVATAVSDGGHEPPSVSEIAASYRPPNPADLTRVVGHEDVADADEAKVWMVRTVLDEMDRYIEVGEDDVPRFREGHSLETARFDRKKIVPRRAKEVKPWSNAFNPHMQAGTLANGIRLTAARHHPSDDELEESMKAFGWLPHHPAIRDEYGVTLVGNRRLVVAEKLGVEPQIVTMRIGDGNEADALRFQLAVGSNLGGRPLTPKERARLAKHLYLDAEWSMERVAEALAVDKATISRDLKDAPKRTKRHVEDPEWQAVADPLIRRWMAGEITRAAAVREGERLGLDPCSNGTFDSRRSGLEEVATPVPTSCTTQQTGTGVSAPEPVETEEEAKPLCRICGHEPHECTTS